MSEATMSVKDIKDLVTEIIKAAKAPTAYEQSKIDEEIARKAVEKRERDSLAQRVLGQMQTERLYKSMCSHEHANGDTHCVAIKSNGRNVDYILCQQCQAQIRPGPPPKDYNGPFIYDTAMYNKVFQKTMATESLFG